MAFAKPAAAACACAGHVGIDEGVLLAIGQRYERLDERTGGDGMLRISPVLCEDASGAAKQEPGEIAVAEVLFECGGGALRKERGILRRERSRDE